MSNTNTKQVLECQSCGTTEDVEEVEEGLVLCYTCESDYYTSCTVCERYMHRDSSRNHRHIFEVGDDYLEYGVGGVDMDDRAYEEIRKSLFAFLDKMGAVFAADLGRTIKYNNIGYDALHTVTGLVLGPTMIFCYLTGPWGHFFNEIYCHSLASYGEQIYTVFTNEDDEVEESPCYMGFMWLFGLGDDTPEENARTRAWIREWARARKEAKVA